MKAVLTYAEYSPNVQERTYHGQYVWYATEPTSGTLKFMCLKDGHTISLVMAGVGVPYLHSNSEYEIEIKIKEIPKTVEKEYIIK
ncbi:MAG: hypothetical protein QN632_08675 [Nitrososphaeraceae archaeon]|nr:hypothetical protein [Nitrososphaeraceae archaeon]